MQRKDLFEVVGIVAIIISLGFVAYEINQNTQAVRSSVIQSVSEQSIDAMAMLIEVPELREARRATNAGTASVDQRRQVFLLYGMLMRIQQNRYMQAQLGLVDESLLLNLGGRAPVYRTNEFHSYWEQVKASHEDGFRTFVETELMAGNATDASVPW